MLLGQAIYEKDTFLLFADTLEAFEQACVEQLALHKPWDLGIESQREPALLHKEVTPNGCKAVVKQHPAARMYLDLGSGVGQAALVTSMISGMMCHGIELQPKLHAMAVNWCHDSAQALPTFASALVAQAGRLHCADMLGMQGTVRAFAVGS